MTRICCLAFASTMMAVPARAQVSGPVAPPLTAEQIAASESLAPNVDQSAAREKARLDTFRCRPLGASSAIVHVFANISSSRYDSEPLCLGDA